MPARYSSGGARAGYRRTLAAMLLAAGLGACASDPGPYPADHSYARAPDDPLAGVDRDVGNLQSGQVRAYVSGAPDSRRSLVLFHEWWGLTDGVRAEADRYAALGYLVVAPDLYGREPTTNPRVARRYMRAADAIVTDRRVAAALSFARGEGRPIGLLGWCFGGGQALRAAIEQPEGLDAVVVYYGELETDPERLARIAAPVLGIFGSDDRWITPGRVAEFTAAMAAAGRAVEVASYEAGHAFANPSAAGYDGEAARDARAVVDEFLDTHMVRGFRP